MVHTPNLFESPFLSPDNFSKKDFNIWLFCDVVRPLKLREGVIVTPQNPYSNPGMLWVKSKLVTPLLS